LSKKKFQFYWRETEIWRSTVKFEVIFFSNLKMTESLITYMKENVVKFKGLVTDFGKKGTFI